MRERERRYRFKLSIEGVLGNHSFKLKDLCLFEGVASNIIFLIFFI